MNREQFVKHYAVQRKNSVSLKWDLLEQRFGDQDLIPMWVADMDFRTPECITPQGCTWRIWICVHSGKLL